MERHQGTTVGKHVYKTPVIICQYIQDLPIMCFFDSDTYSGERRSDIDQASKLSRIHFVPCVLFVPLVLFLFVPLMFSLSLTNVSILFFREQSVGSTSSVSFES